MEKLGLGDARQILSLLNGEEVASSKLSPRMAGMLRSEGLLLTKNNGSRCKYRMADVMREPCRVFLAQQFGLKCSLEEWIGLLVNKNKFVNQQGENSCLSDMYLGTSRSELVAKVGNSKYKKLRTFRGFLVDCYAPIEATLNHRPFLLNPQEGSSVFINTPETFDIPEDVIVIGMENAENFMQIRRQKYLFDALSLGNNGISDKLSSECCLESRFLFVSRYPQESLTDLRTWLMRIPNRYVHFGDFDLAGIHIYLSEFYAYLGDRASFLVPSDIEERLADGNASLYDQQYAKFKKMEITDKRLLPLVDMIHQYHRGYEQEGYIK